MASNMQPNPINLGTLVGGGDCLDHYHNSDRFPPRDSLLWMNSLENVVTVSDDYTITYYDDIIVVDTTSKTITLPSAKNGRKITVLLAAVGSVTIQISGTDGIITSTSATDTSVSITTRGDSLTFKVLSDGVWGII